MILTFDCYGTLIDWRAGIAGALRAVAGKQGIELDSARALDLHARIEPRVQVGGYRSYREVLRETGRQVLSELGCELPSSRSDFLTESLPDWPAFADTREALLRLQSAGSRLGILSNIDDDLLAGTIRRLEVSFDLQITAEQVRSYKPAHRHFEAAREVIGTESWTHVAQSLFHDVKPALELGVPVVWINRLGEEPPDWLGTTTVRASLAELAATASNEGSWNLAREPENTQH